MNGIKICRINITFNNISNLLCYFRLYCFCTFNVPAASSAALELSLPLLRSCFSISSIPDSVVAVGELLVSALPLTTIFSQLKTLMGWEIFWMLVIECLLS